MGAIAETKDFGKRIIGLAIAVVIVIAGYFIPTAEGLTREGILALAILLGAVSMWICNTLPAGATGILALAIIPLLGVADLATTFSGFGSSVVIFAIVIFAITAVIMKTSVAERIIGALISWAKADSNKLVFAFMAVACILSMIMSNTLVIVLFMGFAKLILDAMGAKVGSSNLGKCLMIGIPVATVAGGFGTPVGSSFNIMALGILEQATGSTVGFLQWSIAGIPVSIVTTIVFWFTLTRILKPEAISEEHLSELREATSNMGKLTGYDIKGLVIVGAMLLCWILGTWFPIFNITIVAIIGFAIMFLPGLNMLEWPEFQKEVPWNIILMLGSILCMGGVLASTGGAAWVANMFLNSGVMGMGMILALLSITAFAYLLHTFVPVGPAILSIFMPPVIALCATFGVSPAVPTIILAGVVAGNFLLPINPAIMFTYSTGYYSFGDMFKTGLIPAIVMVVLLVLWVPFISGVMGF